MNTKDTAMLRSACECFADKCVTSPAAVLRPLETPERNLLAQKILLLPELDRSPVFFKYFFAFSPAAAGEMLGVANPRARLACCAELLAAAIGLGGDIIDDASMEAAARRAMSRYLLEYGGTADAPPHSYSNNLRRRLDEISTIPRRGGAVVLFIKRALIAALIATMMVSYALAASPALREAVFKWVVNTFPKYSRIGAANVTREPTEADFEILKQYHPTYIPEGYELYKVTEMFPWTTYAYRNAGGDMLFFDGSLQDESLAYYDSEGAVIETLTYLGQPAFYWKQGDTTFFIWQQDGFQFSIMGEITKDEAIKMAKATKF